MAGTGFSRSPPQADLGRSAPTCESLLPGLTANSQSRPLPELRSASRSPCQWPLSKYSCHMPAAARSQACAQSSGWAARGLYLAIQSAVKSKRSAANTAVKQSPEAPLCQSVTYCKWRPRRSISTCEGTMPPTCAMRTGKSARQRCRSKTALAPLG